MNIETLRARLAELAEQRTGLVAEMEAVTAAAEAESRSEFNDDEQARFDAAVAAVNAADGEIEATSERLAELEKIAARQAVADDIQRRTPVPNINRNEDPFDLSGLGWGAGRDELHARARTVLDDERSGLGIGADERAQVETLMRSIDTPRGDLAKRILVTGKPAYRSAFAKVMSDNQHALTDAERQALAEVRAASLTDAAGGYAVPFTLDPTIIDTGDHSVNPFRQLATVRSIVTDSWNGVSSAGVTASWDGEEVEVSDDAPTLAQPSIAVHKAAAFVPFSIEIGMDWAGMESDVRMMFSQARDDLEAAAHATGTGTGQPTGIVTALTGGGSVVPSATTDTFAVGDLYAIEEALPARYRARASWVANKAIYNDVRQFGTADSHALWERLGAGQPANLLGYPSFEASEMDPSITAAADNYVLILGDFSNYYIIDRIGMSVELVPHLFATANNRPTGQRGLYAYWRTGADSVNDGAFRMLNVT
jgi:HK97 family phage major capsid protein